MDKKKRDYLMFKIRGRIVKVDPDIFYKIRSGRHEPPYKKYNGDIASMRINSEGYAVIIRGEKPPRKHILLSRFVMDAKQGQIVDHRNRNPLDNRRENLRIVTKRQNLLNRKLKSSSGFIGVACVSRKNRHYCDVSHRTKEGKRLRTSFVDTPENRVLAALSRDKFVLEAGDEDYAPLNFPCFKNEPFKSFLLKEDLRSRADRYRQNNENKI